MISNLTDEELLQRYKADGNSGHIGLLFDRYALLLLGMCMKYMKNEEDARDSVQQVFLKVLSEVNRHEVQYFRAWIYQVAKNHCLMQLRKKHIRYQEEITDQQMPDPAAQEDMSRFREKDQLLENMEHALEQLNPEQQTCIRLFYLDKQSYQQISEQTGFTLLQIKSYIQNGKRNLKHLIEKQPSHKR